MLMLLNMSLGFFSFFQASLNEVVSQFTAVFVSLRYMYKGCRLYDGNLQESYVI